MTRTASAEAAGEAPHVDEQALVFGGPRGPLVGVIARPHGAVAASVLMVSGAGGTRAGHGRMVTMLARALAARRVASLRFDVAGQGDSPGTLQAPAERAGDLAAAARTLRDALAPATKGAWLLADGEDAMAAAIEHAARAAPDFRPAGLVLLLSEHHPTASLVASEPSVEGPLGRPNATAGTAKSSGPTFSASEQAAAAAGNASAESKLPSEGPVLSAAARAPSARPTRATPRTGLLARLWRMLGLGSEPAPGSSDDTTADSKVISTTHATAASVMHPPRGPAWDALLKRHPALATLGGSIVLVVHGRKLRTLVLRRAAALRDDGPGFRHDTGTEDPVDAIAGFLARQIR